MNKLLSVIIIVLIGFLAFKGNGCSGDVPKADTLVVHDTSWQVHDSLIVKKMKVTETIHDTIPPEYVADTNYPKLKAQYEELAKAFLAKNIYADTLKLDTLGYIAVADTVQKNELLNRAYSYQYKIPTITNTVTITKETPKKNQFYIGGGIDANKTLGIVGVNGGVILKNKKDQIYGLKVATDINGSLSYGFQTYWKIKAK
ncbi:MAG: hypothetical protein EBR30_01830 [Cytophagia bacterium]|nr:hypothetical protein [Cytophagia bacterium]